MRGARHWLGAVRGVPPGARAWGVAAVVALLVSHGADLAAASVHDGRPPLFFAAALGATDVVAMMLARRADPDARCLGGLSALHFAAAHGAIGSVRMLPPAAPSPSSSTATAASPSPTRCAASRATAAGEGHAECHALLLRHLAR